MIEIFTDTADLQLYLPTSASVQLKYLKPDIDSAFREFVEPYLSRAQYDASVAYAGGDAGVQAKHTELLSLVKKATGFLGLYRYYPSAKVTISSTGITYAADKDQQASKEDKADLAASMHAKGLRALEDMLTYLEAEKTTFAVWAASDSYTLFTDFFIRSASEFKVIQNSRVVFHRLKPYIEDVQFDLEQALPSAAVPKLQTRSYGGGLSAGDLALWKQLLEKYIQPYLQAKSLSAALNAMALVLDQAGTITAYDNTSASMSRGHREAANDKIEKFRNDLDRKASKRLTGMHTFIQANAALFGYVAPETTATTVFENDEEIASVFLGSF